MTQSQASIQRFELARRIEHFVLLISFTTLGLTGLPQKYALSSISLAIVRLFGGIENLRMVHHVAAVIFLLEAIYHVVMLGYKLYVQRRQATMMPSIKDAVDAWQAFLYNLGLSRTHPKMGRYNFTEKAEYWAMLWGLLVMAATGFMLWNPIATTNIFSGEFIPAAKIAHGGEALLAVLAIILWHFYHVHLRRFNTSMFTGKMNRAAMHEEHGAELEEMDKGLIPPMPSAAEQRRRMTVFAPLAVILSLALLGGVYYFVNAEKTSIETLPPAAEQVPVYVPQTATPAPTAASTATAAAPAANPGGGADFTWEAGAKDLFKAQCGTCHAGKGAGGFSADSYDTVLKQIKPGDPDNSKIVTVQKAGGHPGQFSADELDKIINWIKAGAPQQ